MQKRIVKILASCTLVLSMLPISTYAAMDNFKAQRSYRTMFDDVSETAWYANSIVKVYELGLMNGKSTCQFAPNGNITLAETIALAARMHATYHGNKIYLTEGEWYASYIRYALQNDMLEAAGIDLQNPTEQIPRDLFAQILYTALPTEEYTAINTIADGAIADVSAQESDGKIIYTLYAAGVLRGSDASGRFLPTSFITRAQGAAIMVRMVDASQRQHFVLTLIDAEEQIATEPEEPTPQMQALPQKEIMRKSYAKADTMLDCEK